MQHAYGLSGGLCPRAVHPTIAGPLKNGSKPARTSLITECEGLGLGSAHGSVDAAGFVHHQRRQCAVRDLTVADNPRKAAPAIRTSAVPMRAAIASRKPWRSASGCSFKRLMVPAQWRLRAVVQRERLPQKAGEPPHIVVHLCTQHGQLQAASRFDHVFNAVTQPQHGAARLHLRLQPGRTLKQAGIDRTANLLRQLLVSGRAARRCGRDGAPPNRQPGEPRIPWRSASR